MAIEQYLNPVDLEQVEYIPSRFNCVMGDCITPYTAESDIPPIPTRSLVMLGIPEERGAFHNLGCEQSPNIIRRYLYNLAVPHENAHFVDFGNIIPGQTQEDTYAAMCEVLHQLYEKDNTVILLGGSQDLTYGAYMAYVKGHRTLNLATIDSRFDMDIYDEINSRSWLRELVKYKPNELLFYFNLGYQNYFVGRENVSMMEDLKFDVYRLGELQKDLTRAEAVIRFSNFLSVDVSAIRQSDAPGNGDASPHGFYGEEFCTMMRYAGMNERLNCVGIFEVNPLYDNFGQTSHMVAQGLWYFIEGYYCRKSDSPEQKTENYKHFYVNTEDGKVVDFYKSMISDRWWMALSCEDSNYARLFGDQLYLPCTYADYQQAMTGELPELWWRYYQRIHDSY